MGPNMQEAAHFVRFTEEIPNGKLHFLCAVLKLFSAYLGLLIWANLRLF